MKIVQLLTVACLFLIANADPEIEETDVLAINTDVSY